VAAKGHHVLFVFVSNGDIGQLAAGGRAAGSPAQDEVIRRTSSWESKGFVLDTTMGKVMPKSQRPARLAPMGPIVPLLTGNEQNMGPLAAHMARLPLAWISRRPGARRSR